jgi:ribonuclease HII
MSTGLAISFSATGLCEAGLDEAGRGCLAGPVFAAAVVLNQSISNEITDCLNDSKQLSSKLRNQLRSCIEAEALDFSVASADNLEIDKINILNASILAMHRAIAGLKIQPDLLLIDGNRFHKYQSINHQCVVKGDGLYYSIAAASVLAKTYRDDWMMRLHDEYPHYNWLSNKGYPTREHRESIQQYGLTPLHRRSFNTGNQMVLEFKE